MRFVNPKYESHHSKGAPALRHNYAVNLTTHARCKAPDKRTVDFHSAILLHYFAHIAKERKNIRHKKTAISHWKRRFLW